MFIAQLKYTTVYLTNGRAVNLSRVRRPDGAKRCQRLGSARVIKRWPGESSERARYRAKNKTLFSYGVRVLVTAAGPFRSFVPPHRCASPRSLYPRLFVSHLYAS